MFEKIDWQLNDDELFSSVYVGEVGGKTLYKRTAKDTWEAAYSMGGPWTSFDGTGPNWYNTDTQEFVDPARTFSFPKKFLPKAKKKLDKLNKKADKLGQEHVSISILSEFLKPYDMDDDGYQRKGGTPYLTVVVEGEAPRIEGYAFLARIEHTPAGNIINTAPGVEMTLKEKRDADNYCDHCGKRRARKNTFILQEGDSTETIQVGRSCLADFLRGANPTNLVYVWEALDEMRSLEEEGMEEDMLSGGGDPAFTAVSVSDWLAYVSRAISIYGWVSKKYATDKKPSTFSEANFALGIMPRKPAAAIEEWKKLQPHEADKEMAEKTMAWVESLPGDSDFEHNMKVIVKLGYVEHRNKATIAWAVAGYMKAMDLETSKKKEAEASLNEYFGSVGDKIEPSLRVVFSKVIDGTYGYSTLFILKDEEGRTFKWFASGDKSQDFEKGEWITGKCTIKGQEEREGKKETAITRCRMKHDLSRYDAKAKKNWLIVTENIDYGSEHKDELKKKTEKQAMEAYFKARKAASYLEEVTLVEQT